MVISGHVSVDVAVDRPLEIGIDKAIAHNGRDHAFRSHRVKLEPIHALGISDVRTDVLIQIPALIFADRNVHSDKLVVHVFGPAILTSHASSSDHHSAEQPRGHVAQFVGV
jgi:hypothetical protein